MTASYRYHQAIAEGRGHPILGGGVQRWGGGGLTPPQPDFIVGKNEIYKRNY